jgi:hypothetical protein
VLARLSASISWSIVGLTASLASEAKGVDDYKLVIGSCKKIEGLLEDGLGAKGRGLHDKVTSVQDQLPPALVKKLRFIATIRNQLVHESDGHEIDDKKGFKRACSEAEDELNAMIRAASGGGSGCAAALIGTVSALAMAASLLFLLFSA